MCASEAKIAVTKYIVKNNPQLAAKQRESWFLFFPSSGPKQRQAALQVGWGRLAGVVLMKAHG